MTADEIKHAINLAKCYLTGGDSPPLRTDTTPTLAHAVLALHAEVERMRPAVDCRGVVHVEAGGYDDRCRCGAMRRR